MCWDLQHRGDLFFLTLDLFLVSHNFLYLFVYVNECYLFFWGGGEANPYDFFGQGCFSKVLRVEKKYHEAAGCIIIASIGQSFHVQNALTRFLTCFGEDGGGVEGLGWGLMSAI